MRLLLDTHTLLWWLADEPHLSAKARRAITAPGNVVMVSAASVWEIAIKRGLGKLDIPDEWCDVLAEGSFRHLPITWAHARHVEKLPAIHADPFDRMLVAQAVEERLVLVTRDDEIRRYDVPVLIA